MTLVSLTVAVLAGFCNPWTYGLAAHTCSKHPDPIDTVLNVASHSYCTSISFVPSVLPRKSFASSEQTGQVFLYHTISSSSSCPCGDAAAFDTPPAPPSDFLLFPFRGYFGSCSLAASFVLFLLYPLGALLLATWLYLLAWKA